MLAWSLCVSSEDAAGTAEGVQRRRPEWLQTHVSKEPKDALLRLRPQQLVPPLLPGQLLPAGVLAAAPATSREHLGALRRLRASEGVSGDQLQQHPLQEPRQRESGDAEAVQRDHVRAERR